MTLSVSITERSRFQLYKVGSIFMRMDASTIKCKLVANNWVVLGGFLSDFGNQMKMQNLGAALKNVEAA